VSAGEQFQGNTLSVTDMPEEKRRAMRYIAGAALDVDDARLLLAAVFGVVKPSPAPRGLRRTRAAS
jgi:hypothetical protein